MTDDLVARLRHEQELCTVMGDTASGAMCSAAADAIETERAFRERDKAEIKSLRETVDILMRGSRSEELIDEANALRDDLRQATTKLAAAEARVRELEAINAALNERAAQYERLYRNVQAETIERCAKVADDEAAHYRKIISEGKGEHGKAGYVRDDTWVSWDARERQSAFLAVAIRQLAQEVKHEAE